MNGRDKDTDWLASALKKNCNRDGIILLDDFDEKPSKPWENWSKSPKPKKDISFQNESILLKSAQKPRDIEEPHREKRDLDKLKK